MTEECKIERNTNITADSRNNNVWQNKGVQKIWVLHVKHKTPQSKFHINYPYGIHVIYLTNNTIDNNAMKLIRLSIFFKFQIESGGNYILACFTCGLSVYCHDQRIMLVMSHNIHTYLFLIPYTPTLCSILDAKSKW